MRSASRPPQPRHVQAAIACAGLVLMLHAWLLSGVQPRAGRWIGGTAAAPPRVVQVRQVLLAAPVQRPPAVARPAIAEAAAPPSPPHSALPVIAPWPTPAAGELPPGTVTGAETEAEPPAAPVYATRLPPAATLHYSLRRSSAAGRAVLRWAPDGGHYGLSLQGQLQSAPPIGWSSQGTLDAHGIAPDRYTESRRGREVRAANFQRERARITFSGPPIEHALPPGAQDRLSWMLQLGAVLAADPALESPGREVLLFVVGSRGDAEVWTFSVQGRENIELPGSGNVPTVLLRRQPRRLYDTLAEVWLDPARHHLPVRAHLSVRGDSTEFVLDQLTQP